MPSPRKLLSSGLQEFLILMLPSSLGQPLAHQRNLEPPQEGNPNRPRTFEEAPTPPPHEITVDFLHSLDLPAICLIADDMDSASEAKAVSNLESGFERELIKVCPHPCDFQDISCNSSMRVGYRDLVPMTRLLSTWLPISETDQRHLINSIQGWEHPPGSLP